MAGYMKKAVSKAKKAATKKPVGNLTYVGKHADKPVGNLTYVGKKPSQRAGMAASRAKAQAKRKKK